MPPTCSLHVSHWLRVPSGVAICYASWTKYPYAALDLDFGNDLYFQWINPKPSCLLESVVRVLYYGGSNVSDKDPGDAVFGSGCHRTKEISLTPLVMLARTFVTGKQKCRKSNKAKDSNKKPQAAISSSTWRKEKGRWSRSFRWRPHFWWNHHSCLTSQPEETRGPKEDHPSQTFPLTWWQKPLLLWIRLFASNKRANLRCKVDTGAGGNVMPFQAFAKLFSNWLTETGMPHGTTKMQNQAYSLQRNQHSSNLVLWTPVITWKDEETKKVNKMNTIFYVADTPGPANIRITFL